MEWEVVKGLLIPLLGTVAGAALVFFLKNGLGPVFRQTLSGFAGGVMTAASVWSLLIPAMEQSAALKKWAFLPASVGFAFGILFFIFLDALVEGLQKKSERTQKDGGRRSAMVAIAVALHNLPEGMAVGAVYVGFLAGNGLITSAGALALAIGIAVQNIPEGAIVSMPLYAAGMGKGKAFVLGALSGVIEPIGALLTIFISSLVLATLPYFLAFAAGAMIYVVVKELIPDSEEGNKKNLGVAFFAVGFCLMMILDVALG